MGTSTVDKIAILKEEVEVFRARIEEHDTGHLYTTIGTLEHRIEELEIDAAFEAKQKEDREIINKGYISSYE
tara:strand:- start:1027 stop:1242 length:216 start_codon:yes stop_codon:yes gene_type:complete